MLEVSNLGYETPAVVQYQRSTVIATEFTLLIVVWIVSRCAWVCVVMARGFCQRSWYLGHWASASNHTPSIGPLTLILARSVVAAAKARQPATSAWVWSPSIPASSSSTTSISSTMVFY